MPPSGVISGRMFSLQPGTGRYLAWLTEYANKYGLEVWAYGLMTNHIHLIAFPHSPNSQARTLATTHTRYSGLINLSP